MSEKFEVIPGESIGPFKLGMTRQEIEALKIEPMQTSADGKTHLFSLEERGSGQGSSDEGTGVTVEYDATDHAVSISARFGYSPLGPPIFTLFGEVVNGMTDGKVGGLLRSVAGAKDVKYSYGSVTSASAGLSAVKWEAIDDHIMCIEVAPKK